MPVCHSREAFKILPAVLIYLMPAVFMFSVLIIMSMRGLGFSVVFLSIFLPFFIAFDLTAVIYILFFKIRHKADYIAMDHHIYDVVVFKETYVRIGGRKTARTHMNVQSRLKRQEREKLLVEMTTCVNYKCENYALELESRKTGGKRCPSCGRKKYTAKVFTGIMTCIDRNCEQFGQELKKDIEECSLCGGKIGRIALKFNPNLTKPAFIFSAASCIFYAVLILTMYDHGGFTMTANDPDPEYGFNPLIALINLFMFGLYGGGVVTAWISNNKIALGVAIAAFPLVVLFLRIIIL
jgi:hypothetical protein